MWDVSLNGEVESRRFDLVLAAGAYNYSMTVNMIRKRKAIYEQIGGRRQKLAMLTKNLLW